MVEGRRGRVCGWVCNQENMLLNYPPCKDSPEGASLISGVITEGSCRGHNNITSVIVLSTDIEGLRVNEPSEGSFMVDSAGVLSLVFAGYVLVCFSGAVDTSSLQLGAGPWL